ncbi:MAG: polyprenyl diphosphate synthase [Fastidiosipilaceae bacterium]|jgi:undecaprenyl diphosphate synthase
MATSSSERDRNRRGLLDRWFAKSSRRRFSRSRERTPLTDAELRLVPKHIAIIMDGNGRWAQMRGMNRSYGHRAGTENLKLVTEACGELGVKYLTVYAFSTENWKRPKAEVDELMRLFIEFFHRFDAELAAQGVRLRFSGNLDALSQEVRATMADAEAGSLSRDRMQLIIAFNYGGRQELVDAFKKIAIRVRDGELTMDEVDEQTVSDHLYLPDVPDPELILRPGGEMRLSNFLLWEAAYAEFWTNEVLWPDFDKAMLEDAIRDFIHRDRRFGGVKEYE